MTQVLRIGQGRTGYENSVGFLYSDENDFSGWSPFIDAVLKLVRGSRSITTTQEGRIQETFTVLGRLEEFVTVKRVQLDVSRLTQMFDLAGRLNTAEDETEQVWFVEKMEDEPQERRAIIYSGNISPVDDSVIDRQMSTGNALYVVTVERSRFWEYGKIVGTQGGAAGADLKVHGGRIIFTRDYASQGTVGRMTNLVIRPQHSYIKKMWLGIKPNRTGVINPRIIIKSKQPSTVGGVYPLAAGVEPVVDADAADKRCIDINFRSEGLWQWKPRFRSEFSSWNTATLSSDSDYTTERNRSAYLGNYRLIGRYKIMGDAAGIVGVRVGTGWRNPNNVSWGDRYFLEAIVNDEGTSQWHYFDFGSISIGGGLFSAEVR
ncbi:hypothetical protein [Kaarinaea lacus]